MGVALATAALDRAHDWHEGPPLTAPRYFHAAAATAEGQVIVFGGWTQSPKGFRDAALHANALEVLDPNGTWRQGPPPPKYQHRSVLHFYTTVLSGSKQPGVIFDRTQVPTSEERISEESSVHEGIFGGSDGGTRAYWFEHIGPIYFDAARGVWDQPEGPVLHQLAKFWTKRVDREDSIPAWQRERGSTATGPDGRFYLSGGKGGRFERGGGDVLDALEMYDPHTDSWKSGAPMAHARWAHASAFGPDGKLYVFGGCACRGGGIEQSNDPEIRLQSAKEAILQRFALPATEVYDPGTNRWQERAPMPHPRQDLTAATGKDGLIYVIGGTPHCAGVSVDTVDVYNPATDRWSEGPPLPRPFGCHASAVTPGGRIWVTGGFSPRGDHPGPQSSVEYLDTAPDSK